MESATKHSGAVDLYVCSRCGLTWVPGTEMVPERCPACRLEHSIPQGPITVAHRAVKVNVVRDYGLRTGLLDERVRTPGLAAINPDWCPHNWINRALCNVCRTTI